MPLVRLCFLALAAVIAAVGVLAAIWAEDYLRVFGLGLVGFAAFYAWHTLRRHGRTGGAPAAPAGVRNAA